MSGHMVTAKPDMSVFPTGYCGLYVQPLMYTHVSFLHTCSLHGCILGCSRRRRNVPGRGSGAQVSQGVYSAQRPTRDRGRVSVHVNPTLEGASHEARISLPVPGGSFRFSLSSAVVSMLPISAIAAREGATRSTPVDNDNNGEPDGYNVDRDGDGTIDKQWADPDGDGVIDTVAGNDEGDHSRSPRGCVRGRAVAQRTLLRGPSTTP